MAADATSLASTAGSARAALSAERWVGPAGETCAMLVHSSDRPSARPWWRLSLLGIDHHMPPLCQAYFSYDAADADAKLALQGTRHPITLLRRGQAGARPASQGHDEPGWSGAMLADLDLMSDHTWVFHVMDDALIPDKIHSESLRAVLDAAQEQNASTVSLYARSFGFWNLKGAQPVQVVQPAMGRHAEDGGTHHRAGRLEFYRATSRSLLVIQQNFALWRRDALVTTLRRVGPKASPAMWETQLERLSPSRRETAWPDILSALVVVDANGPADALLGVEDVASQGQVKDGASRCAWIRFADRLGIASDAAPGGGNTPFEWPGASYAFCTVRGAVGDGARVLRASQRSGCGCRTAKKKEGAKVVVKGVYCACTNRTT